MRASLAALGVLTLVGAKAAAGETPRFGHKTHEGVRGFETYRCSHCHQLDAQNKFTPLPPGRDAHKPCSDATCHGARLDTVKIEGGICAVCHEQASRFGTGGKPARLILPRKGTFEFSWRFNHKKHLAMDSFRRSGGARCEPCHSFQRVKTEAGAPDLGRANEHQPDHADCHECHQPGKSSPLLTECDGCHLPLPEGQKLPHPVPNGGGPGGKYLVLDAAAHKGDPRALFSHEKHAFDPRGAKRAGGGTGWSKYDRRSAPATDCAVCHNAALDAKAISEMKLLPDCAMNRICGQCHNGDRASSIDDCEVCHRPKPSSFPTCRAR